MQKCLECIDNFILESNWKNLLEVGLSACAFGLFLGMFVPKEKRKKPLIIALIVSIALYVKLMIKFIQVCVTTIKEQ